MTVDLDALLTLAVLALSVGVVSFILAKTVVAEPWRKWARNRSTWLGKLAGCPLCTSVWITFASAAVFHVRIFEGMDRWQVPFVFAVGIFAQVAGSTFIIGMMTKAITAPQAADPNPKPANRTPAAPQIARPAAANGNPNPKPLGAGTPVAKQADNTYAPPREVPYSGYTNPLTPVAEGGKPIGRLVSQPGDKSAEARRTLATSTPAKTATAGWGAARPVSGYCPGTAGSASAKHADCKAEGDHYGHGLSNLTPTKFTKVAPAKDSPRSTATGKPVPGPNPDEKPVTERSAAKTALKFQAQQASKTADSTDKSPQPGTPA